jgi:shikimate dehydrogenase
MDVDAAGASVVLCGTGPVAMSTLLALINDAAASVIVVSRDKEKGSAQVGELCARLDAAISLPALEILDYSEVAAYLETADILINATTLGMNPSDPPVVPADALRSELIVFDVIYGHGHTALRKAADTVGARFTDGIGMLVEQAALTLEIWMSAQGITREVPRELMYKVAEDELAKQELPK